MDKRIEDRHLIDRFLQGDVSGIELEDFNRRIDDEENFRREVELQKLIYSGVQKANRDQLKKIILTSLDYRRPTIPFALKMIVTFLVVTGFGITLWFYVGNETTHKNQANSWFAFLKSKKGTGDNKQETEKQKPEFRQKIPASPDTLMSKDNGAGVESDSGLIELSDLKLESDSNFVMRDEDIVVKQDQLISSARMVVEDKSTEKSVEKEGQLTKEAVELLNPGADLPDVESVIANYLVEFWISPINYRGYKMSKNKLILFGIDEPEAVKLYRVNEDLYMSYLNEFYRLNNYFDFVSYQKLKDIEIPTAIK